jgi:tellurium resistance protein TerD
MATFQLEKGGKFQIEKGIKKIEIGLGWDAQDGCDLDGSVFGLVHLPNGQPKFYGEGTHAICYANTDAKRPDGTLASPDGAIIHSGDARQGGGGDEPDEVITVDFSKMPTAVVELAVWITIYHSGKEHKSFANVHKSYFRVVDVDGGGAVLCHYDLGKEFGTSTAVQVGSFTRNAQDNWEFTALGAGSPVEIGQILQSYS